MMCPQCSKNASRVIDSRPSDDGRVIRRRRVCENCGYRFTTFERIEQTPILVIKKNGNREEFNREKVLRGVVRAAEKRPVTLESMNQVANRVEAQVRAQGESEINSRQIGEYVMQELIKLDDIAYIRFASVYRQFKDINGLMKEVQGLMENEKKTDSDSQIKDD
ncbi:transcriptional repressor NrdR [Lactobacillus sp. DCY120]|uniref:Transcriptional repressor NrdR n=1 Tax=Bombilactobacillus apium TaxID=2675299 RepID=A0A850R4J0_9LACO|nr:transcriptional regulator NrdR [Bombilactobacillus apium]NVY96891.1 transcriptional repressor NrdR [Bombilactobacillus apium]